MTGRFFKQAGVSAGEGGFAVTLDARPLKTPAKAPFRVPSRNLAEVAAAEWNAQADTIKPETMPITRLINVALDHTPRARAKMTAQIGKFAETDLLCHRAKKPAALVERQARLWDPLLAWADTHLEASLIAAPGVLPHGQPEGALTALAARAAALDDFRLTGLAHAAGLAGSAVVAFALAEQQIAGPEAFEAASLDDLFQLETWGEDAEARQRLNNQKAEYAALERFFASLIS
ncbi:MAG TPA: ATP12 family protein [Caulobacterales bacterium]|jgi:chaperone required for assembly of F1-ATPase|nr:ATP12 family protein [Caulobacterales bacterium]